MHTTYSETILIGVPHYQQGNADGLCVYYAMSMVLVALYPEYHKTIHERPHHKKGGSPIFLMLKELAQNDKNFKEEIGNWYFNGMKMADAAKLLNALSRKYYKDAQKTDYFIRHRVKSKNAKKDEWNISDICKAISWHLPVIIAGGGIPNHAVVAVGWAAKGKTVLIEYHDPARVGVESLYARDIFYEDCEAIIPNQHLFMKHRPPAIIIRDKDTYYEAWDPKLWPNK